MTHSTGMYFWNLIPCHVHLPFLHWYWCACCYLLSFHNNGSWWGFHLRDLAMSRVSHLSQSKSLAQLHHLSLAPSLLSATQFWIIFPVFISLVVSYPESPVNDPLDVENCSPALNLYFLLVLDCIHITRDEGKSGVGPGINWSGLILISGHNQRSGILDLR